MSIRLQHTFPVKFCKQYNYTSLRWSVKLTFWLSYIFQPILSILKMTDLQNHLFWSVDLKYFLEICLYFSHYRSLY